MEITKIDKIEKIEKIEKFDREIQVDENELNANSGYQEKFNVFITDTIDIASNKYTQLKSSVQTIPSKLAIACDYASEKYTQLKQFFGK